MSQAASGHGGAVCQTGVAAALPLLIALLWEGAARSQWLPGSVFAPLSDTFVAGWKMLLTGELLRHIGISLARLFLGAGIGVGCGLAVGTLIGAYKTCERLVLPTLGFLLPVPPIAWIPLFIVIFGINGSRIALITAGTFLFVAMATATGIRSLSKELIEVAELYEYRGWRLLFSVLLPGAASEIVGGIRASVGISWILLVASELIASTSGVGWLMWNARTFSRPADMQAACLTISLLGIGMDLSLVQLQRRLSLWRVVFAGY